MLDFIAESIAAINPETNVAYIETVKMGKFVWGREITNHLIDLYQRNPLLYCTRHSDYKNRRRREETLEAIRKVLCRNSFARNQNLSVNDIKMKIHGLRTQYFKEIKRLHDSEASGGPTYVPSLWSFEQLSFLRNDVLRSADSLSFEETTLSNEIDTEGNKQSKNEFKIRVDSPEMILLDSPDEIADEISSQTVNNGSVTITKNESTTKLINIASNALQDYLDKSKTEEDDLATFAKLVEIEMRKIEHKSIIRKTKKDILTILMEAQNEDSEIL